MRPLSQTIFLAVLLAAPRCVFCQNDYRILTIGPSLGKGYGVDFSYGRRELTPGSADKGADVLVSIWTPDYTFPISTDNSRETGQTDYDDGAYLESSKDYTLGTGVGARYCIKPVSFGGMFDLIITNHYDFYRNPVDNSKSHLRKDTTLGGWTGTAAVSLSDKLSANGFYGTRRGINIGLAWNVINP